MKTIPLDRRYTATAAPTLDRPAGKAGGTGSTAPNIASGTPPGGGSAAVRFAPELIRPLPAATASRLRRQRVTGVLVGGMVLVDLLAVLLVFLLALPLHNERPEGATALLSGLIAAAIWVASLAAARVYDPLLLGRRADLSTRLLKASLIAVVAQILLVFLARPGLPMPGRIGLTAFWLAAAAGLLLLRWTAWRELFIRLLRGRPMGGALVVGAGPDDRRRAGAVLRWMLFPPEIVAYSADDGVLEEIVSLAREGAIDQVIVTREDLSRDTIVELVQRCVALGLTVTAVSHAFDVMVGRTPVTVVDGMPVIEIQPSGLFGPARRVKRAVDFTGAFLGGAVLLPLFGLIALLVKLSSPGPVLYRQERVGRGGRRFYFYKFRTMVVNNDEGRHRAYLEQLVQSGSAASIDPSGRKIYKLVDDPRITRIGAFLRRTSLDELPQLWNVLKGEMSLVGPRPCLHYEWDLHKEWQKRRLDVTPGLTGLWQVTGRSRVSFEEMVLLDLYYIARWSVGLDLELILRTIPVMLFGLGGH